MAIRFVERNSRDVVVAWANVTDESIDHDETSIARYVAISDNNGLLRAQLQRPRRDALQVLSRQYQLDRHARFLAAADSAGDES